MNAHDATNIILNAIRNGVDDPDICAEVRCVMEWIEETEERTLAMEHWVKGEIARLDRRISGKVDII